MTRYRELMMWMSMLVALLGLLMNLSPFVAEAANWTAIDSGTKNDLRGVWGTAPCSGHSLDPFNGQKGTLKIAGGTAHIPVMKAAAKRIMTRPPSSSCLSQILIINIRAVTSKTRMISTQPRSKSWI